MQTESETVFIIFTPKLLHLTPKLTPAKCNTTVLGYSCTGLHQQWQDIRCLEARPELSLAEWQIGQSSKDDNE